MVRSSYKAGELFVEALLREGAHPRTHGVTRPRAETDTNRRTHERAPLLSTTFEVSTFVGTASYLPLGI